MIARIIERLRRLGGAFPVWAFLKPPDQRPGVFLLARIFSPYCPVESFL